MTIGVVVPCYRQEQFLPRTVAALELALAQHDWRGVLVQATPAETAALPALSGHWTVRRTPGLRVTTPGVARNLGLAECGGVFALFVDADIEVDAAWLARALDVLAADPGLAGAWGRLEEWFVDARGERPGTRDLNRVGELDHDCQLLAGLALYRREALERVGGYEPRLNSEEDFELGLRLRRAGFRLRSLGPVAAKHWSGPRPSFSEIGRRWRTGLCFGQGQVLRLYLGRPGFRELARRQSLYFAMLALGLAAVPAALLDGARGVGLWALAPVALLTLMTLRKRSARLALHALLTWSVHAAGLVVGFARGGPEPPATEGAC